MNKKIIYLTLLGCAFLFAPVIGQVIVNNQPYISSSGVAVGPLGLPDGSITAPALYFISEPALGIRRVGAQSGAFSAGAATATDFGIGPPNSNQGIKLNGGGTSGVILASLSKIAFTVGNEANTQDTSLSRSAAGVVAVGTGAQGSTAGTIAAALHTSTGTGMAVANVGANSCGTTTATIAGGSNAFVITVGATAGTQCRVAFPVAATTEYTCSGNDATTTIAVRVTPIDTTHVDFLGAFVAGDKVNGVCFAR